MMDFVRVVSILDNCGTTNERDFFCHECYKPRTKGKNGDEENFGI